MKTLLAAIALIAAVPTLANTVVVNGNTTGGPTFQRTLSGNPPTSLSVVGTAVRYQALAVTVSAGGSYTFTSQSTTAAYDPFLSLYSGTFAPASPLVNILVANDDLTGSTDSGFTRFLTAGNLYFAVQSGFDNLDFGTYTLTIAGPGIITVGGSTVPEPAAWALLVTGFGIVGSAMRSRRMARIAG